MLFKANKLLNQIGFFEMQAFLARSLNHDRITTVDSMTPIFFLLILPAD